MLTRTQKKWKPMKTIKIHVRGVEHREAYSPLEAKTLSVNAEGFVTFVAADGKVWNTQLSEVSSITLSD